METVSSQLCIRSYLWGTFQMPLLLQKYFGVNIFAGVSLSLLHLLTSLFYK